MINMAIVVGNLGDDPKVIGKVTKLRVATNYVTNGEKAVEWHTVVCFGKTGEFAAEYLKKGSMIFVEGTIRTNEWKDKDGNKRTSTEILANRLQKLSRDDAPPQRGPSPVGRSVDEVDPNDDIPF